MEMWGLRTNEILGPRERFERFEPLLQQLESIDLRSLSVSQLEDLDRIGAQLMQSVRHEGMWRRKLTFNRDWKKGPGNPEPYCVPQKGWADHCRTMFVNKKKIGFISFPYSMGGRAIKELAECVDEGWDVEVNGIDDIYFPGRTVAILLKKP